MHAGQNTESGNLALMERRPCVNRQRAPGGEGRPPETQREREVGVGVGLWWGGASVCSCTFTRTSRDEVLKGLQLAA